jgi:hypothetical protein
MRFRFALFIDTTPTSHGPKPQAPQSGRSAYDGQLLRTFGPGVAKPEHPKLCLIGGGARRAS